MQLLMHNSWTEKLILHDLMMKVRDLDRLRSVAIGYSILYTS